MEVTKEKLNKNPVDYANNSIKFLNGLSEDDLKNENIKDIIPIMTRDRKVVNKYHHLDTVQAKVDIMAHQVKLFIDMFDPLFKKGLPFFQEEKDAMLNQKEYHEKLIECILDHTNFVDMNQSLSGRRVADKLADEFEIFFAFKEVCAHLQNYSYSDHIELCVLANEMSTLELPSIDQWKTIEKFGRTKYTWHT